MADIDITDPLASLQSDTRPGLLQTRSHSYGSLSQGFGSYEKSPALSERGDGHSDSEGEEKAEDLLDAQPNLHNINQLRSAGENRRFTDEMHYMLEGFAADQPLSVQRAR